VRKSRESIQAFLFCQKQAVKKQTKINKNKYTARESNTTPAATLRAHNSSHDLDKHRTGPVA